MQDPITPIANAQLDRPIFLSGSNCTSHRENSLGIYEYDSLQAIKLLKIPLRRVEYTIIHLTKYWKNTNNFFNVLL